MEKENKKTTNNYVNHSAEIPTLRLTIARGNADFVTENITLCSSGWNVEEAQQGMDYLIKQSKGLKEKK